MKNIFLSAFIAAVLAGPSCAANNKAGKVVPGNQGSVLTQEQIVSKKAKALDGSREEASALADYYSGIKLDYEKAFYWVQIAAENGDINAMHSYWVFASQSENLDDQRRGLFWLKQAAAKGHKLSQKALESIEKSESNPNP